MELKHGVLGAGLCSSFVSWMAHGQLVKTRSLWLHRRWTRYAMKPSKICCRDQLLPKRSGYQTTQASLIDPSAEPELDAGPSHPVSADPPVASLQPQGGPQAFARHVEVNGSARIKAFTTVGPTSREVLMKFSPTTELVATDFWPVQSAKLMDGESSCFQGPPARPIRSSSRRVLLSVGCLSCTSP